MISSVAMRYAVWNNKGGVGKSFLSFIVGTEIAHRNPAQSVILVDMCPQANLSEIVLGGNGKGANKLEKLLGEKDLGRLEATSIPELPRHTSEPETKRPIC
jgi:cellulose biosynthesis protein BcsQ